MTPLMERFVLHWGEMGSRWGVNRSVAQIHGYLFVIGRPVDADELTEKLSISRSNVSGSLKELQGLGLVKLVHRVGERRDYFETVGEPWEMALQVAEARRQREIQPTLEALRAMAEDAASDAETPEIARRRITELSAFGEELDAWYREVRRLPVGTLRGLMRMGAKIARLIPGGGEKASGDRRGRNSGEGEGR